MPTSSDKFPLLKSCNTLSSVIIFDFPRRTTAGILSAAIPRTEMKSDLNLGGQCSELAISALNLNAESQAQDKSFLSYYRLFYLGKAVSEFYCKACKSGLGHVAPDKCDRCRPCAEKLQSLERKVVGFTQVPNGIMVGEYLVSASLMNPLNLQMRS